MDCLMTSCTVWWVIHTLARKTCDQPSKEAFMCCLSSSPLSVCQGCTMCILACMRVKFMQQALLTSVSGPCRLRRWIYNMYNNVCVNVSYLWCIQCIYLNIVIKVYHNASHKMGGTDTLTSLSDFSPQPAKLTSISRYTQPHLQQRWGKWCIVSMSGSYFPALLHCSSAMLFIDC